MHEEAYHTVGNTQDTAPAGVIIRADDVRNKGGTYDGKCDF